MTASVKCRLIRIVIVGLLVAVPISAQATFTDKLILWDGNTIMGELKSLQQGKLEFKINKAGTIFAEWEHVHFLSANKFFEVENREGLYFYGTLNATTVERQLMITELSVISVLNMDDVVTIRRIKERFLDRVDGFLDLGLSFTSAESIFQYTVEANATYRERKYQSGFRLTSFQTRQEGREDVVRDNFEFHYTRYHKKRYFSSGTFALNRSSELGLQYRVQIGYAFGRTFVQSKRNRFRGSLGFALSREQPIGDGPKQDFTWGVVNASYRFFLFAFPKTDIFVDLSVLPGITDRSRYRVDFNGSIRREVFKAVTVNFSIFDSYDSDPPPEATANHDFGYVLSVGWSP